MYVIALNRRKYKGMSKRVGKLAAESGSYVGKMAMCKSS